MSKVGGRRNFGYGKTLAWAGKNALTDRYGQGHYATRAAHAARWRQFSDYARGQGIKDARAIGSALLERYGQHLRQQVETGQMTVAYAQNLLSTANVVLASLRGDDRVRIKPAETVGHRQAVKRDSQGVLPESAYRDRLAQLGAQGEIRTSSLVELAWHFGLRFREAALLDVRHAMNQANRLGRINVTRGTKGGRGKERDRWVPVTETGKAALERAAMAIGSDAPAANLIAGHLDLRQWRERAYGRWSDTSKNDAHKGFHPLRRAYACRRYQAVTGQPAPCLSGRRLADRALDTDARVILAQELGHGRTDVIAAYIGSAR